MKKEKFSQTLLKVASKKEKVETLINRLLSTDAEELDPADKLSLQAFCCALLADTTKNIMQIKQYINEYCEYLNKAFIYNENAYLCRLVRIMVESNMHDAKFISHIEEDANFLRQYSGEVEEGYRELADYILQNIKRT